MTNTRTSSPSCTWVARIALAAAVALFLTPTLARADEPASSAAPDSSGGSSAESSGASSGGSSAGSARTSGGGGAGLFGEARQWVYSISDPNEFPFWIKKTGDGDWDLTFRPALDVFVARNISVGGVVTLSSNGGASDIGLGARAGYNVPLTSLVSLWIRGGLYYHHLEINNGPIINETVMDLTVPFLFHLVPHFFVGAGPLFHLPLSHTQNATDPTYGLTAIVGGWL